MWGKTIESHTYREKKMIVCGGVHMDLVDVCIYKFVKSSMW